MEELRRPDRADAAPGATTALPGLSTTWPDHLWSAPFGWLDALLRSCYGIHEFTDDPHCIFRIALEEANLGVTLADGTRIEPGDPIGSLHFWNEHLPRFSARGPDLGWAAAMRRRIAESLASLSQYIETAPDWAQVQAIRADPSLANRRGSRQVRRVAQRYGFERLPEEDSSLRQLHDFADSLLLWGLTRAFNPAALPRQPFRRQRHVLWISRAALARCNRLDAGRPAAGRPPRQRRGA